MRLAPVARSPAPRLVLDGASAALVASGAAFRAALTPSDVSSIGLASSIFQGAWLLPLLLYAALEPSPRRFPMSISWTIRKGTPRLLHHSCWLGGWALFLATLVRSGDWIVAGFSMQMFATGAIAVILCPLGTGRDRVHWLAALAYIADHAVMFSILGTASVYVALFWSCFGLMAVCAAGEKAALAASATDGGGAAGSKSALLTTSEWGFMLGEYGLFVFFLVGMTSGLGLS